MERYGFWSQIVAKAAQGPTGAVVPSLARFLGRAASARRVAIFLRPWHVVHMPIASFAMSNTARSAVLFRSTSERRLAPLLGVACLAPIRVLCQGLKGNTQTLPELLIHMIT